MLFTIKPHQLSVRYNQRCLEWRPFLTEVRDINVLSICQGWAALTKHDVRSVRLFAAKTRNRSLSETTRAMAGTNDFF